MDLHVGTGDLCENIGLIGVSAKWSYVTASPSHHDQAIPILSPLLFMHVGHPYIKIHLSKEEWIGDYNIMGMVLMYGTVVGFTMGSDNY